MKYSQIKIFCAIRHLISTYQILSHVVGIAFAFSDSSFNSVSTSKCFVLSEVIFLFTFCSLSLKSVFLTKLSVFFTQYHSFLRVKFMSSNIKIMIMISSNFIFSVINFYVMVSFFGKITKIRYCILNSSKSSTSS